MIPLLIPMRTLLNNAFVYLTATSVSSLRHEQPPCDTSKEEARRKNVANARGRGSFHALFILAFTKTLSLPSDKSCIQI